jgi:hypothetical protein
MIGGNMSSYQEQIAKINKQLEEKTLGEIQSEMKTSRYDYTGVGFGYQLIGKPPQTLREAEKTIETPEFDRFLKTIKV